MLRLLSLLWFSLCSTLLIAQTWTTTSAPTVPRYDDIYFLDEQRGWGAAPYQDFLGVDGQLVRTTDGGDTWDVLVPSTGYTYRSMAFFDDSLGFIGNLEAGQSANDTALIIQTTDGGSSWFPVPNLPGPRPGGVCGMFRVNDSLLYAAGRYYGPAGVYKTTDRGNSWTYTDLDSLAGGLVDMYFWHADSGIVVGSSGLDWADSAGVVLQTFDGGQSWQRIYRTQDDQAMCWKISFPSDQIGYISVQNFTGLNDHTVLKTTDRGVTWAELPYYSFSYNAQGVGFINDSVGFIGGTFNGSLNFATTDGGLTWTNFFLGSRINRFRFPSDSVGYASGRNIYKFDATPVGLDAALADQIVVHPIYPNPVQERGVVVLELPTALPVESELYGLDGKLIWSRDEGTLGAGEHQIEVPTGTLATGSYFLMLKMDGVVKGVSLVKQ